MRHDACLNHSQEQMMKRFQLNRWDDESGISGTGVVLRGVIMPSGKVVIEWREPMTTITIYENIDMFRKIHVDSHPGCSEIQWIDEHVPS